MGFDVDERNSTPRLTLSKPPYCKPREAPPPVMQTPPPRPSISIPFHWEEAPGKPRAAEPPSSDSKVAAGRCLDLPPRLMSHDDYKFNVMPSPTTVLGGPYVGRSLSLACTFSFRKGPASGREEGGMKPAKRIGARNFGSGRWGSFKEEGKFGRDRIDISHSLGDIFKSEDDVKITRVRRRRSFFALSSINTTKYLWADIYASFKQAIPWRRSP